MKIINNTDTELVVTGSSISSKKILAGDSAYIDPKFDYIVITCCYGSVSIAMLQEFDDRFQMYPHEDLGAACEFDNESRNFVVKVYRVTAANKRSNSWFVQQDKLLHDKELHDASTNLTSAHIVAYRRIDNLTDAIKKSIQKCVSNQTTSDVKQIRNWAKEIMFQCNIIDSIDED